MRADNPLPRWGVQRTVDKKTKKVKTYLNTPIQPVKRKESLFDRGIVRSVAKGRSIKKYT